MSIRFSLNIYHHHHIHPDLPPPPPRPPRIYHHTVRAPPRRKLLFVAAGLPPAPAQTLTWSVVVVVGVACCCCIPLWLVLKQVLTFAPCTLIFAPCTCGGCEWRQHALVVVSPLLRAQILHLRTWRFTPSATCTGDVFPSIH